MKFSEGSYYKLQKDYYEHIKLECTYVEGNTVWLLPCIANPVIGTTIEGYKLNKKTNKLYKWNDRFKSWDNVENTLSEYGAEDIWSRAESYRYDELGKGD